MNLDSFTFFHPSSHYKSQTGQNPSVIKANVKMGCWSQSETRQQLGSWSTS